MTSKVKSVRLEEEIWNKIDSCKEKGCRNYIVKNAVMSYLDEIDSGDKKSIVTDIDESEEEIDPEVTIIEDEKEPEPTVAEIPVPTVTFIEEARQSDNSGRPTVQMSQFNGKLLPFARRYDI